MLLHFVTWLLIPLTTAPHGSRPGGRAQPDARRVGHVGGLRGTKRQHTEEASENLAMGLSIKAAFARQRQTRSELLAPPEHLHPIPLHGTRQPDATDSSSQCKELCERHGCSRSRPTPVSATLASEVAELEMWTTQY